MAFGGGDIGRHMALDAERAIPMMTVDVPPICFRASPIPVQATTRMGTRSAAVAVLEMKLERM